MSETRIETRPPQTGRVDAWTPAPVDEAGMVTLAELVALAVRKGDQIELEGALGAGKSTFARALIKAVLGDDAADVPSPTFSLVQTYDTPRLTIAHADLYRLRDSEEACELGLDEARAAGLTLIEWPERAIGRLATDGGSGLLVEIADADEASLRRVTLTPFGAFRTRLTRLRELWDFILRTWRVPGPIRVRYLQGDASARAYTRLVAPGGTSRVLMDAPRQPDGPPVRDGLPYSRIAHLAEDVRPFVAIGEHLASLGARVPHVHAADIDRGLLLLDDLGDDVFASLVRAGGPQRELWAAAVDMLVRLRGTKPLSLLLPDGDRHVVPRYDVGALAIEVELLVDWLWPAENGSPCPPDVADDYRNAWGVVLKRLAVMGDGLVLRDFHSPNLIRVPTADGRFEVGVIDFQDAVLGPVAYDLASLLFDARVDVAPDLEREMFERYVSATLVRDPYFDRPSFEFAYAALAVQRNTKILGIFARLSRRDGKHGYLVHLPRIWAYLERGLAHPELGALRGWFDQHWPADRRRVLPIV